MGQGAKWWDGGGGVGKGAGVYQGVKAAGVCQGIKGEDGGGGEDGKAGK